MVKDIQKPLTFTYMLVITAFFGTKLFTLGLGAFELSIFRILVVIATVRYFLERKNISNRYGYRYYRFIGFWVIYSLLLLVTVIDFSSFAKYFIFLFSAFIVTYYSSCYLTKVEQYVKILRWFELIAIIFSSIGLYEIITGDYHFAQENSLDFYSEKSMLVSTIGLRSPMSVFANPNDFGLFLLFSLFVSYALFFVKTKLMDRLLSLLLIFYFAFLIVSTQSRSIFMSMMGGIFLWMLFDFAKWKKTTKVLFILAILLSLASVISWLIANEELYLALISADEGSDDARWNLIKYGFVILSDTFFLGTDIGNIEAHMARYAMHTNNVVNIHNWWMEVLVSSGVMVFFYYIIVYVRQIIFYFKNMNKSGNYTISRISQAFLCFMITFILGSITSSSIFPTEWMWTAFCVIFSFPEVYKKKNRI